MFIFICLYIHVRINIYLFSRQQFQFNDHCHDPSECVVSNSIPVSLLFLHSVFFRRNRVARGANLTENFERNFSTLILPWLSLASYIWAVDAARHGLEDLGKDDAGEGRFWQTATRVSRTPCPSSSSTFFSLPHAGLSLSQSRSIVDSDVSFRETTRFWLNSRVGAKLERLITVA